MTGDDIGSDGIVELIKLTCYTQIPTGKIALIQLKGTKDEIVPLKTALDFVSVRIKHTTLDYIKDQDKIPVILVYSSIRNRDDFYYLDLRLINKENNESEENTSDISVRIPIINKFTSNPDDFFKIIGVPK